MAALKNLRIGTRLGAAFGLITLLMAVSYTHLTLPTILRV